MLEMQMCHIKGMELMHNQIERLKKENKQLREQNQIARNAIQQIQVFTQLNQKKLSANTDVHTQIN